MKGTKKGLHGFYFSSHIESDMKQEPTNDLNKLMEGKGIQNGAEGNRQGKQQTPRLSD